MAWPDDPTDQQDPQAPYGGGQFGGGGAPMDWLSGLLPILAGAAAFKSPAAGAAIFGVGDYLRRQRMSELSLQRQQRLQQIQEQRDAAMRQQLQDQGLSVPEGMSSQDMIRWAADERLRRKTEYDIGRQQRAGQAFSGIAGLQQQGQGGLDPRAAYEQAVGLAQHVGAENMATTAPILERMREQSVKQGQAEQMLPPARPPEQFGPSQLDPEDRARLAAGYGRGEIPSIPAWLERTGRNPMLAGPEGRKYVTEQTKLAAEREQGVSEQMTQSIRQRRAMGLPISYAEAQLIGAAGPMPAMPDEAARAAYAAGVRPEDIAWAPPDVQAKMAGSAQSAAATAQARREAQVEGAKNAPLLARAGGVEDIRVRGALRQAEQMIPIDVRKQYEMGASKLDIPALQEGPFPGPGGSTVPARIVTPRQQASAGFPAPISEKDQQARVDLTNTMGILADLDVTSKKIITARTPGEAQKQAFDLNMKAGIPIPFTGTRLSVPFLRDPEVVAYAAQREGFLGQLSRTFGAERGVLTNQDIMRVSALTPDFGDTAKGRAIKMNLIKLVGQRAMDNLNRKLLGLPMPTYGEMQGSVGDTIQAALAEAGVADPTAGLTPAQIDARVQSAENAPLPGKPGEPPPAVGAPIGGRERKERGIGWGSEARPLGGR